MTREQLLKELSELVQEARALNRRTIDLDKLVDLLLEAHIGEDKSPRPAHEPLRLA